jgi:hypothetical protein
MSLSDTRLSVLPCVTFAYYAMLYVQYSLSRLHLQIRHLVSYSVLPYY